VWARKDKKGKHTFNYDLMKNGDWPEDQMKKPGLQMRSVWSINTPKPIEKKLMIEYVDKTLIKFLRKFAPPNKIKVVVTADHSTPCKLKAHSADPVPVLFYNDSPPKEKKFCEREAAKGTLGKIMGNDLLKKVGFVK